MSGDILQRIDATVEQAREQLCGCGCGAELRPDGPSLYYATQDCQQAALRASTRDPQQVERRGDYSFYSEDVHERDARRHEVPERAPREGYHVGWATGWRPLGYTTDSPQLRYNEERLAYNTALEVAGPPQMYADPHLFDYVRRCAVCGQTRAPRDTLSADSAATCDARFVAFQPGSDRVHRQNCSVCDTPFEHPIIATSTYEPVQRCWLLQARSGALWASYRITVRQLADVSNVDAFIAATWLDLTRSLLPRREALFSVQPPSHYWSWAGSDPLQDMREWIARERAAWLPALRDYVEDHFQQVPADSWSTAPPSDEPVSLREAADADTEPTDPQARALWLLRRRNTGPARQQRAPRSIDPRRAR